MICLTEAVTKTGIGLKVDNNREYSFSVQVSRGLVAGDSRWSYFTKNCSDVKVYYPFVGHSQSHCHASSIRTRLTLMNLPFSLGNSSEFVHKFPLSTASAHQQGCWHQKVGIKNVNKCELRTVYLIRTYISLNAPIRNIVARKKISRPDMTRIT